MTKQISICVTNISETEKVEMWRWMTSTMNELKLAVKIATQTLENGAWLFC